MIDYTIIPECYLDTNLIETIVPPTKGYNHQKGCGSVARLMQGKLKDKFAVGIVDKDKNELKYAEEFAEIVNAGDMQLFRHKNAHTHHYLIFINPAIERWIMNSAENAGLSLSDFGLPNDLKELTKRTKKITSKKDDTFRKLFKELKSRKVKSMNILTEWIKHLKEKSFGSNAHELIEIANRHL